MEEIEVPLEQSQEHIHEAAHHAKDRWIGQAALFSAVVAAFAAVSALMAGHNANEAMITQIKSSDAWNYYQAKGVKSMVLQSKMQLIHELGQKVSAGDTEKDNEKVSEYKKEQEEISKQAHELEEESKHHLMTHEILAKSVTLFQISIAVAAVSVLSRRRKIWAVSVGFALIGVFFFLQGLLA